MKDFNMKLFLFISCVIVLCVFLRITGNSELSNVQEPDIESTLTEVEVERKNPDIPKTTTKKTTKKKKSTKKKTQIQENNTTVVFEKITKEDYKTTEAVVKIEQEDIKVSTPVITDGDYWKTYDPTTDPNWDAYNPTLPKDLTDEIDNQI